MSENDSPIERGVTTSASKKDDAKTPEVERFPTAERVLDRYRSLRLDNESKNKVVTAYLMKELDEGKSGDQLTANPTQPGNTEYERHSDLDIQRFLQERLQGKVIDIGSGGANEMEGIVPDSDVVYVDSNPQEQSNFYQVSVGKEPLPFSDNSFGAVYSRNAIQSQDGARAILPEAWRVLEPGGHLVIELQYLPDGERDAVLGTLTVLEELGVNVEEQGEIVIDEAHSQHKQYEELRFNEPSIFLSVTKGETHS